MNLGHRETGGMISGWFLKLTLTLALLALLIVDAGSIIVSRFGSDDVAKDAGRAAADKVNALTAGGVVGSATVEAAYGEAAGIARLHDGEIVKGDFLVYQDGRVHLTFEKKPKSLLLARIPAVRDKPIVRETVTITRSNL